MVPGEVNSAADILLLEVKMFNAKHHSTEDREATHAHKPQPPTNRTISKDQVANDYPDSDHALDHNKPIASNNKTSMKADLLTCLHLIFAAEP